MIPLKNGYGTLLSLKLSSLEISTYRLATIIYYNKVKDGIEVDYTEIL